MSFRLIELMSRIYQFYYTDVEENNLLHTNDSQEASWGLVDESTSVEVPVLGKKRFNTKNSGQPHSHKNFQSSKVYLQINDSLKESDSSYSWQSM